MELSMWTILGLGLVIGLRHALDPDHVIAVSTITSRHKNVWKAGIAGVYWGVGHTITILLIGLVVLLLDLSVSEQYDVYFEWLVAVVLIYLGISAVRDARKGQFTARQAEVKRGYHRSLLTGMVHGLAGSAALMLLMLSQIEQVGQGLSFLLLFGAGSVLGMYVIALILSLPMRLSKSDLFQRRLVYGVGLVSITFGFILFFF
ncbi:high-affinity nickel-transporter [Caldalkalibacillus thermarum TA2.A1]|uniref:High-affinity nickel-transporter n=1 Tax=Caldalkalibacillus thermarum (strain TA2.A1) TaxID=986075 RepID=F5LAY9_CALTT|nr:hypothetical protein [Caldalkalibacillus thermarum]EGL81528.1 high-affinity nickel-transporter [Caldalkalibacillus thermarum TA2.A1]QZT33825.1 urease accessory protein UreH [Caldalkalibacillus thermarum TA2.A1]